MSSQALEAAGGSVDYRPAVVNIAKPSAGTDATFSTSGSEYYDLIAVSFTIATSGVAGNRTPVLQYIGGDGTVIVAACAGQAVTSSSTARYTYARGLTEWDVASTTFASGPMPDVPVVMGEVARVVIHIEGMDAGDQLSSLTVIARQVSVRLDTR